MPVKETRVNIIGSAGLLANDEVSSLREGLGWSSLRDLLIGGGEDG